MSPELTDYLLYEKRMLDGDDSDKLLETLDELWYELSDEDRAYLNARGDMSHG